MSIATFHVDPTIVFIGQVLVVIDKENHSKEKKNYWC
jgi:hypothetical protein